MRSKSLKVTIPVKAEDVETAIASLSDRFLRMTKSGCRVGLESSEFNVADLCKSLIEDWKSGKVAFASGEITLTFIAGNLSSSADILVYTPDQGSRFLYTGGAIAGNAAPANPAPTAEAAEAEAASIAAATHTLQAMTAALNELTTQQRAAEKRLQELLTEKTVIEKKLQAGLEAQTAGLTQTFTQILSNHITSTALHFSERLDKMQKQLDQLAVQLQQLSEPPEPNFRQSPQTEAEWLKLIQSAWGTVGDYEQYSFSYRTTTVETPLFSTPDWVALCELEWARQLHPTLALLYDLIHSDKGIGYAGADILQHLGCHRDPQTDDRYYLYHQDGFTAYEVLWQTATHPHHSWLPELQRLYSRTSNRQQGVFEMFGWETEAIAALESVVKRAAYDRQSPYDSAHQSSHTSRSISNYLALLNIGPFTPITVETIKQAYRQAMKIAHPDTGGSKEQAQRINAAYEAVLNHYFPKTT